MNRKINLTAGAAAGARRPDYRAEIAEILRSALTPKPMKERILTYHENDIAAAMELLNRAERARLYSILDAEALASVLAYSGQLDEYIHELTVRRQVDVLSRLEASAAADCLHRMERTQRNTLIELMDPAVQEEILLLSSFDEDEIGSRMSTNYISIQSGSSVHEAMRTLIAQAEEHDNISTLYVVSGDGVLVGAIELKKLIIARKHTGIDDITMTSYPYVYASEQIDDCVERIKDYSEDSIPVLDGEHRLRGVLTSQEILQLADDAMGDDYAKLALIRKEACVGLANGLILGFLSVLLVGTYLVLFKAQSPLFAFSVSLCTGFALLLSIVLSSLSGTVVPILFKRLNVDPAVASGPLITTINDLIAVVSFYGLVWIFLINILRF